MSTSQFLVLWLTSFAFILACRVVPVVALRGRPLSPRVVEALGYIAYTLEAPKAARDLLSEFDKTVRQIAEYPYAHELYRTDRPMKDEIRKVPVKNYVLYYAVFQDRVEIRRFLYGKRDKSRIVEE